MKIREGSFLGGRKCRFRLGTHTLIVADWKFLFSKLEEAEYLFQERQASAGQVTFDSPSTEKRFV